MNGLASAPWGPLARGELTRPNEEFLDTVRGQYRFAEQIDAYRRKAGTRSANASRSSRPRRA
jgi:hypothetical protein